MATSIMSSLWIIFTKYIWFYPLVKKSDTKEVCISFKAIVKKFFEKSIKTLYSDNRGEYEALSTYLPLNGLSHLTLPPHTPEHNGYAELRHRYIVDTELSLLSHAKLPLEFWSLTFTIVTYLINRLITLTLSNKSAFHCLFGKPPNYQKLRSFGCLCYPWVRPYSQSLTTNSILVLFHVSLWATLLPKVLTTVLILPPLRYTHLVMSDLWTTSFPTLLSPLLLLPPPTSTPILGVQLLYPFFYPLLLLLLPTLRPLHR